MNTLRELSNTLSETLTHNDLHGVAVEGVENILDALLEDGLAKDIPIIGTIYAFCKFGISVKDRLFFKKLLCFLSEVAPVPAKDRAAMISSIDGNGKYQIKVGEQLLYILDKSDDHENARIVAFLFAAFLSGESSYDDFLRASRGVQSVMTVDLWRFVEDEEERWDIWAAQDLLQTGFIEFDETQISVKDADPGNWKNNEMYEVSGGELTASITKLGENVRRILRSRRATRNSAKA